MTRRYVATPWGRTADEVLRQLDVDSENGLSAAEVAMRQREYGLNVLRATPRRSLTSILIAQLKSVVVTLLLVAGVLALVFGDYAEGMAIFAVIAVNTALGFGTELRAVRSMEALGQFARSDCRVLRNATAARISADDLVPGDIVVFEAGDLVPADLRLVEAAKLTANESTLTGESLPVRKNTDALAAETAVLDRHNMLLKGTSVTRGSGRGVVTGTGKDTEFGKIFTEVAAAKPQQTPLEKRLDALGARLVWFIAALAVVIAVTGIAAGRELFLAIEVAIALSVAAIPEGLAIVATIALARGIWRMADRNALITRLSAVETLGATSVILTDKTGTLTENLMAVSHVLLQQADVEVSATRDLAEATFSVDGKELDDAESTVLDELLTTAALCSNATLDHDGDGDGIGDPTELALLMAAAGRNIWRDGVTRRAPELKEDPFDPYLKRMATLHELPDAYLVAVKGAPEAVLPCCTSARTLTGDVPLDNGQLQAWLSRAEQLGDSGLRTLAIARKTVGARDGSFYDGLTLLGIVGMEDPVRDGVVHAIRRCRDAGIEVIMVTGDHAATARNVAVATGIIATSDSDDVRIDGAIVDQMFTERRFDRLLDARVFSRVTPGQKLQLIDMYQEHGHVVAMTGDGVNDAPALKKADIGVAMGVRGTAVAKEAAVMILQDDEFETIVAAVSHGRAIFENIRKFVVYLLSCNTSEVLVISLATISGAALPLLPLQILFLNLVTDVFPALALGVGEGSPTSMKDRPRPASERILTRRHWLQIGLHGLIIAVVVLASMTLARNWLQFDYRQTVSVAFCTLAL
ncbi:MAG: cation-translocating P-type ATPase, partial [Gammaproteobacteria bacterium]|nr:cation-translocating P-type ATPase [Gammaproteobacteria bacterium]